MFPQPHALRNMMRVLVLNDLSSHSHSAVKLMYFETVVRYEKFFLIEPQHLEGVLAAFVDHRGIRNPNVKVQSRCTYLFSRFLKCVRYNPLNFCLKSKYKYFVFLTGLVNRLQIQLIPILINISIISAKFSLIHS